MMTRRPWKLVPMALAALWSAASLSVWLTAGEPEAPTSGETFTAAGKYQELIGDHLRLVNDSREFLLKKEEHRRKVLELTSHRDNLKLGGVMVATRLGKVFEVVTLEVSASDVDVFRAKREAALRAPDDRRADALLKLAREAAAHARAFGEPRVLEIGRDALQRAFGVLTEAATAETLEETVRRMADAGEIPGAEPIVIDAMNRLESRFSRLPAITEACRRLGCRRHDGRWVGYSDYKRLEGFVWHAGRWMKPYDKHRMETIETFRRSLQSSPTVLRWRTEQEYSLLADRGTVALGMKPEEVAKAIGFPERVERRLLSQKEFDQWIYEGNEYYYFYGGYLVQSPR